ncbi:MAG: UDP-N-acetylenolpyruvoylglucosamine reductase [Desulfotomaculum sp. 46_80]|nr:MAG: UDP-N-acetylenolpyruvoylglucosamine reductase [Desulfotomaculum sp. 46_80]
MGGQPIYQFIYDSLPGQVRLNEPMRFHTTWRIGGPADVLVEPDSMENLRLTVDLVQKHNLPLTVIGNGSNILVCDGGIRGVVLKIGARFSKVTVENNKIIAGGGTKLVHLVNMALSKGIGGFEFLAGIPGTVGGAVVMNAGVNGAAFCDILEYALLMDQSGKTIKRTSEELGFGYRMSNLQGASLIVLEACCLGIIKEKKDIQKNIEEMLEKRKNTQPTGSASAGSVFKNPPGSSAGFLIDQAGGKGLRVGDAMVSTVHSNFIVNLDKATAREVLDLIEEIKELVIQRFGTELTLEVKVLGED